MTRADTSQFSVRKYPTGVRGCETPGRTVGKGATS